MSVYSDSDRHISTALVLIIFTLLCFIVGCEPLTNQEHAERQRSYEEQQKVDKLNRYVMDLPVGAINVRILDNPSNSMRTWIKFTLDDKDILLMEDGSGSSKIVSMVILR